MWVGHFRMPDPVDRQVRKHHITDAVISRLAWRRKEKAAPTPKKLEATLYEREAALGLTHAEVAFYDAAVQNDAAVMELGDQVLKTLARKLMTAAQGNATIVWNLKASVRSALRSKGRRLLARYGHPPHEQHRAVEMALDQAILFADAVG